MSVGIAAVGLGSLGRIRGRGLIAACLPRCSSCAYVGLLRRIRRRGLIAARLPRCCSYIRLLRWIGCRGLIAACLPRCSSCACIRLLGWIRVGCRSPIGCRPLGTVVWCRLLGLGTIVGRTAYRRTHHAGIILNRPPSLSTGVPRSVIIVISLHRCAPFPSTSKALPMSHHR